MEFICATLDESKTVFTDDPTSLNPLLGFAVCLEGSAAFPSLKSFYMWFKLRTLRRNAHPNKLSWASPFLPADSCKAPWGDWEVVLQRVGVLLRQAAEKLNKQRCLFVTEWRGDKETRWEVGTLMMFWQTGVMKPGLETSSQAWTSSNKLRE